MAFSDDDDDEDENRRRWRSTGRTGAPRRNWIADNWLPVALIVSVFLGTVIGFVMQLRHDTYTKREVMYARFLGEMHLRTLMCTTFPIFTTSLINGFGHLNFRASAAIIARTIGFILLVSAIGSTLGIALVIALQPGRSGPPLSNRKMYRRTYVAVVNAILDLVRNLISPNVVQACMYELRTELGMSEALKKDKAEGVPVLQDSTVVIIRKPNFLGLAAAASALGIAFGYMGRTVEVCLHFFEALNKVCIELTLWMLYVASPGVLCIAISDVIGVEGTMLDMFKRTGFYMLTVVLGLSIQFFIVNPSLFAIFTRRNPFPYFLIMFPALATAFCTSSSIAALPITLEVLTDERTNVNAFLATFIVPFNAILDKSATVLNQTIAVIFMAQNHDISPSVEGYLSLWLMAILFGFGTNVHVPGELFYGLRVSLVMLKVPAEDVLYILIADWILGRLRTTVNVATDIFVCSVSVT